MYKRKPGEGRRLFVLFLWEYIRSRIATNGALLFFQLLPFPPSQLRSPITQSHQSSYPLGIFRGRFGTTFSPPRGHPNISFPTPTLLPANSIIRFENGREKKSNQDNSPAPPASPTHTFSAPRFPPRGSAAPGRRSPMTRRRRVSREMRSGGSGSAGARNRAETFLLLFLFCKGGLRWLRCEGEVGERWDVL